MFRGKPELKSRKSRGKKSQAGRKKKKSDGAKSESSTMENAVEGRGRGTDSARSPGLVNSLSIRLAVDASTSVCLSLYGIPKPWSWYCIDSEEHARTTKLQLML